LVERDGIRRDISLFTNLLPPHHTAEKATAHHPPSPVRAPMPPIRWCPPNSCSAAPLWPVLPIGAHGRPVPCQALLGPQPCLSSPLSLFTNLLPPHHITEKATTHHRRSSPRAARSVVTSQLSPGRSTPASSAHPCHGRRCPVRTCLAAPHLAN